MSDEELLVIIEQVAKSRQAKLDLSGRNLIYLPEQIKNLQNLTWLDLSNNRLSSLPSEIGQLINLKWLYLSNNQLLRLAPEIGKLKNLILLNLSGNYLKSLPRQIGQLRDLVELDLSENKFESLPSGILKLRLLSLLNLSKNRLGSLPIKVFQLQNLTGLNLKDNQLKDLPSEIIRLQNLIELNLNGNLLNLPTNLLDDPYQPDAILNFYRQLKEKRQEQNCTCEARLIILGEGGAGKTTLAKKLQDQNYQLRSDEESTIGIDIIQWHFSKDGKQFRINIWDFSGQEIDRATHQLFLTEQCLYILVADTRRENTNFIHWLDVVRLLGKNSPLLIIKNEKQNRLCDINEQQLKGRFANLKNILSTNLADNRGLPEVCDEIKHYISMLPHINTQIPESWNKIREVLEQAPQNYLTQDEYFNICQQYGLTTEEDKLQLSSYLHKVGVCLHFQHDSLLKKTVILKPNWCTEALYKVLNNGEIKNNKGEFTRSNLKVIWSDENFVKVQDELLQVMLEFKLCYETPRPSNTYIVPQLLPDQPEEYEWDESNNLTLRCVYEFMPKGVLTRFIAQIPSFIDKIFVWKNGVILHQDQAYAEILETEYSGKEIRIRVTGKRKKNLLLTILHELNKVHSLYEDLQFSKLVPCNCNVCQSAQPPHFYNFENLNHFLDNGWYEIQCLASSQMVDVRKLLDDVAWLGKDSPSAKSDSEHESQKNYPKHGHISINLNLSQNQTQYQQEHNPMSTNINQYGFGDNIAGDKVAGDKIDTQINNSQSLQQAARDIKALLDQLSIDYPTDSPRVVGAKAVDQVEKDPQLKARLLRGLKAGGFAALEKMIDHPVAKFFIEGTKEILQP